MKRSGASIVVHGPYRDPHCTTEGHASSLLSRAIAIIDHIGMTSIIVADITDQVSSRLRPPLWLLTRSVAG